MQKVTEFIERHDLIRKHSTIVVGVSGGPDSLALLHYLWSIQKEMDLHLVVSHVDHMFRGKQSEEDLKFVENYCRNLGILCESIQINVTKYMEDHKLSTQIAARECRYDFYDQVMKKYDADFLALGHHGDDQIETILMRLVRGSFGIGYAGIKVSRPFSTGHIIRPFLCITKDEIEQYVIKHGLTPRVDPSNEKNVYTRNRYRHHILPYLKQENRQVHERFQFFSEMVFEDQQLLEELTVEKMNTVIKEKNEQRIILDIILFQTLPIPLQKRGIHLILNYLYKEVPSSLSSIHIDNLLSFLSNKHPNGELHFPKGLKIVRSYNHLVITFNGDAEKEYRYFLQRPGSVILENGHEIIMEVWEYYPTELKGNDILVLDPTVVSLPLIVRTRKNGDKMTIKGMNGSKKIKDIFIDSKTPMHERNSWPIVEDINGNILWLPGLKKSSYVAGDFSKNMYIVLYYK